MDTQFTQSLHRTASWVIYRLDGNQVLFETFDERVPKHLNTAKYKAVPILEHLQSLNRR